MIFTSIADDQTMKESTKLPFLGVEYATYRPPLTRNIVLYLRKSMNGTQGIEKAPFLRLVHQRCGLLLMHFSVILFSIKALKHLKHVHFVVFVSFVYLLALYTSSYGCAYASNG